MTSGATRPHEIRAYHRLAVTGRKRVHGAKDDGEQQTEQHQTRSQSWHGDKFGQTIARRRLRYPTVARH